MRRFVKRAFFVIVIDFSAAALSGQESKLPSGSDAYVIPRINGPVVLD
jgi:hypothetical protein